jgi:transcriptional repressor NrdR
MHCPYCGNKQSEVVETRESSDMDTIRRRRACLTCSKRYTTYERIENIALVVIKRDKRREQFDRNKLKNGLLKACDKTVIPMDVLEKMVTEITRELRGLDGLEVESRLIGEMVARRLKGLDKVAYIRFASVFKRFVDVEEFEREVQKLTQLSARQ